MSLVKKRIVFTVTNDLTYDRRMQRICDALGAAGFDVTLVGRKLSSSIPFTPTHFTAERITCLVNKGFLFYAEYNLRLFFWLLPRYFDVLCACDLDTALPVKLAAWFRKKKSAFDAHEYFTEVPEVAHRPAVKSIWSAIARLTIPRFDLRYTVGEELARIMGNRYQSQFHVIRNIAPTPAIIINDNILERKKIILYQGALNVGRGLETMLEAMVDLKEWELWLAGEGDITEKLKSKANQLALNDRIKFLGWVIPDNLPDILLQARIHVNLREKGSLNDFYSLPNKFFDAIHAGLPSINMRYPEYEKVCEKYPCAILLDTVSKDKIVEAIQLIEQKPQLLLGMETACREAAKEFNWESESQKLVALYHNLITS